ncbi:MAG: M1 family metallopeptidase [Pirellulaceae bacterium]|nr:M1 family metallopeptidase [Pirellulaceae bacterium]
MNYSKPILFICAIALFNLAIAQTEPTRSQTLRGSITPEREWWDLVHYDLAMQIFPEEKSIKGTNTISFKSLSPGQRLQIDLQEPLKITWAKMKEQELRFTREGNVYYISLPKQIQAGVNAKITIAYQGKPLVSKNPPWSGGISWQKDKNGDHFIATACQGIGASVWWPCKDHGYDEPDNGMDIVATVPDQLTAVANGRLIKSTSDLAQKTKTFHWKVTHPINNYCVNLNVGNYVNFSETITGEGGKLDLDYWVLKHDQKLAARQFAEAPRTIRAFEYWFGKYPFYEDSYKLVQVPYLGMEHQSSVTYGNGFENGYRGTDLSGTGVGLKFDFIIVHESGHEWFGNNISMRDVADMWIHESFTNYSENLFVEYFFTRKEAEDYVIGCRKRVKNDKPIIGQYGINQSGSGDMYYKGGNMLHTIRHVIDNDIRWREILRGLNRKFRHQTVNTQQVETYISKQAKIDLSSIFDQYLRTTQIPVLEYSITGKQVTYHYRDVIDDFSMPIKVKINDRLIRLNPTTAPQTFSDTQDITIFDIDRNFFIRPVKNQTAK